MKTSAIAALLLAAALNTNATAQDNAAALSDSELETLSMMMAMTKTCDKLDNFAVRTEELDWFLEDQLRGKNDDQRSLLEDRRKLVLEALDMHRSEAENRAAHEAMVVQQCSAMAANDKTGAYFVTRR